MKISTRDKKLIWTLGGIILFLVVYMYVFTPLQEKCDQMDKEIGRLEDENRVLEAQYANIDGYEEQIEVFRAQLEEDYKLFPADVKQEDIVAYLLDLQEQNGIEMYSIAFMDPVELVNFPTMVNVEGTEQTVQATGKQIGATVTTELSYEQFKNVLNYIYGTQTQTTLESVSVVYSSRNNVLSGSFDFSKYAISYEGAPYEPSTFPGVAIGQEDLFGN